MKPPSQPHQERRFPLKSHYSRYPTPSASVSSLISALFCLSLPAMKPFRRCLLAIPLLTLAFLRTSGQSLVNLSTLAQTSLSLPTDERLRDWQWRLQDRPDSRASDPPSPQFRRPAAEFCPIRSSRSSTVPPPLSPATIPGARRPGIWPRFFSKSARSPCRRTVSLDSALVVSHPAPPAPTPPK